MRPDYCVIASKIEKSAQGQGSSQKGSGDEGNKTSTVHRVLSLKCKAVADRVIYGLPDKQIAAQLRISEETVAWHQRRLFTRYAVHSRAAMVSCYLAEETRRRSTEPPGADYTNV